MIKFEKTLLMRRLLGVVIIFFLGLQYFSCGNQTSSNNSNVDESSIRLQEIAKDLNSPVAFSAPDDGTNRLFICEQGGLIKVISDNKVLVTPFLNLRDKMVKLNSFYDERGLLGFAFHPDFSSNNKFYVYYSALSTKQGSDHKSIVAEYSVSSDKNIANPEGKIIIEIEEPESNHNGGQLAFGEDGYLYIAVGDGGGAGDKHGTIGNAQDLSNLLGKILRIDVDATPYKIPEDNPFVNTENVKPEIYAYGLRNPWRFSFDKKSGKLFCADVGQDNYEEVNIIEKGRNYGWRIMEATHCFNPEVNCDQKNLVLPIDEYSHDIGKSITGGYVYRGKEISYLEGKYIFADWTGPLFSLEESNGKWTRSDLRITDAPEDLRILSFGEDSDGELYVLTSREVSPESYTGSVYKIVSK